MSGTINCESRQTLRVFSCCISKYSNIAIRNRSPDQQQTTMMDFTVGHILISKQRFNICVCVLVAVLVMCVSSKSTRGDNSALGDTNIGEKTDLKTFLTLHILPLLNLEVVHDRSDDKEDDSDNEQQLREKFNVDNLENNANQENSIVKRKSFAGMGNFDIMTATLDRQRQRRPTMMMMSGKILTMNGLQNLMRQQGRRRK